MAGPCVPAVVEGLRVMNVRKVAVLLPLALLGLTWMAPAASAQGFGYPDTDRWDGPRRVRPPEQTYDPSDDGYDEPDQPRYRPRPVQRPVDRDSGDQNDDSGRYQDRRYGDDQETTERENADRQYRNQPRLQPVNPSYAAPRYQPRPAARDFGRDEEDTRSYRRDTAREPQPDEAKVQGVDAGGQPHIEPLAPPRVAFSGGYMPGSIVIDTSARKLYYVTGPTSALAYPIGVGREGFAWTGAEKISRIADWPDWYPPAEMRKRKPELPERMMGGIKNPLGAKAMYLGNTLYRIHGTNDPKSIGKAESSGCFRMLNANVLHLASLAGVGTQVTVVNSIRAPKVVSKPKVVAKADPKPRPIVERRRPRVVEQRERFSRYPRWRERYFEDERDYR